MALRPLSLLWITTAADVESGAPAERRNQTAEPQISAEPQRHIDTAFVCASNPPSCGEDGARGACPSTLNNNTNKSTLIILKPCFRRRSGSRSPAVCRNRFFFAGKMFPRCRFGAWRTGSSLWARGGAAPVPHLNGRWTASWLETEPWERPASSSATPPTDTPRNMFPQRLTTLPVMSDPTADVQLYAQVLRTRLVLNWGSKPSVLLLFPEVLFIIWLLHFLQHHLYLQGRSLTYFYHLN